MNGSSTAITLVPGWPGRSVADQEIRVWVASCGRQIPPLIPHRVFGALGSVTSASTGDCEPCSWRIASAAAGWPAQLPWSAAHDGTWVRTGAAVGEGEVLGVVVGKGVGLGLGLGEGDASLAVGLCCEVAFGAHAVMAARSRRKATPFLTAT